MQATARRVVAVLALAAATAAALVGGAQADPPVDHSPALGSYGAAQTAAAPDWFERAATRASVQVVRPDDRPGAHGAGIGAPAVVASDRSVRPEEGAGVRATGPVATSPASVASRERARVRLGECLDVARLRARAVRARCGHHARGQASAAPHAALASGRGTTSCSRAAPPRAPHAGADRPARARAEAPRHERGATPG